jgi:hypothetical protein
MPQNTESVPCVEMSVTLYKMQERSVAEPVLVTTKEAFPSDSEAEGEGLAMQNTSAAIGSKFIPPIYP